MPRFSSTESLSQHRGELQRRETGERRIIALCGIAGCGGVGAAELVEAFQREIRRHRAEKKAILRTTGCHGFCEQGPVLVVYPERIFYPRVTVDKVARIFKASALKGEPVADLLFKDPKTGAPLATLDDVPFYSKQMRKVLRLNTFLDPVDLDDYIRNDGWSALARVLDTMSPEDVIEEVKASGLRGRGGGGFPTGRKWEFARRNEADVKYLVCNADEGDPGAFMDRSLLEGTPHAVLEGMAIAAYATGASKGMIYVRAEYPLAVKHVQRALNDAEKAQLIGDHILGTDFSFSVEVRIGAGAFVCGEETALIASLEGRRGWPRPPYPVEKGYQGRPTCINNVETLANIPVIIQEGGKAFASVGTVGSKGTKVFALAGKVNNTGLVEVPMGATLRQVIFEIGGGIQGGRRFKAAQLGGPSGGCLPAKFLDLPIDYDSLKDAGSIMGSGGMIVMDENTCMVDVARFFMEFISKESCGQCTPCREGAQQMLRILTRICEGEGKKGDIEELQRLGRVMQQLSLCGLGQTAPNPALSTIRYFRSEYEAHIEERRCPAGVCPALVVTSCQNGCPAGVNIPEYIGLIAEKKYNDALNVIRRRNPFVSVCGRVCDHPCESACRRGDLDSPLAIRALKRFAAEKADRREARKPLLPPPRGEPEVAVVGSGPAGLSCAYFLAQMGRRSVVFEQSPVPGGMLALGIPEYRLSKKTLREDIDFICSHGVEIKTGRKVKSAEDLLATGFKAVFVGTGAQRGKPLGVPGEALQGVVDALVVLRSRALGKAIRTQGEVVVIGGGNTAVDVARSALRLGADKVAILYRRAEAEMPAYAEEIEEALREGIVIEDFVAPVRVLGKNGRVAGIEMIRMRQGETDDEGRRRPVAVKGSEFVFPCDAILPAIGQIPSLEPLDGGVVQAGWLTVDPSTMATRNGKIFAGGDCLSGGGSVIEAIADGQNAAVGIDRALGGLGFLLPEVQVSIVRPSEEDLGGEVGRLREPMLPVGKRRRSFEEVARGVSPAAAQREAHRCLRCDLERLCAMAQKEKR